MIKTEKEIRKEIARLDNGVKFSEEALVDFEEDSSVCHNFLIARSKYMMKIKVLKWVLNES